MTDALTDLREKWGLANSDIARALHTNTNVIRHWRRGVEPNADEVARADRLNQFLTDLYEQHGITEPAAWMAEHLTDGYTVTRWHLYTAGIRRDLLPANAAGAITNEEMLNVFDPGWRRTYWTTFTTVEAEDGGTSIMGKTYDEVLRQVGAR
jgi:hypothetical protein